MSLLYGRQIRVFIADLDISQPKITFEIVRDADETTPNGEVVFWNLARDTEDRIFERGGAVRLDAGYPTTIATIFEGRVEKIVRERANFARLTKVELTGAATPAGLQLPGYSRRSYQGAVPIRQIAVDLVADMGLTPGPLDLIPADATVEDFPANGPSFVRLKSLLARVDMVFFEDDGVIRFNRVGQAQPDAIEIMLSPETGLVGAPAVTDDGARIRSFLMPLARIGGVIDLSSDTLSGRYKISGLLHKGNNWDGEFITEYDLRELEAEAPSPGPDINQILTEASDTRLSAFLTLPDF